MLHLMVAKLAWAAPLVDQQHCLQFQGPQLVIRLERVFLQSNSGPTGGGEGMTSWIFDTDLIRRDRAWLDGHWMSMGRWY